MSDEKLWKLCLTPCRPIKETVGAMVYFIVDKDWHWRESDRTWIATNDQSKWRVRERTGAKTIDDELHIR